MTDKQKERDNLINTLNGALKDVFEYVPLDSVIRLADILIEKGGIASSEKEQMMTDNDIIKALELQPYCNPKKGQCGKCPYLIGCNDCATRFPQDALDLINRQKADYLRLEKSYIKNQEIFADQCLENEHLKAEVEKWQGGYMTQKQEIANLEAELKTLQKAIQVQERMLDNEDYRIDRARAEGRAEGRAEAITEFVEKLKGDNFKVPVDAFTSAYVLGDDDIDQIAKEVKGEQ